MTPRVLSEHPACPTCGRRAERHLIDESGAYVVEITFN
jgi:hypothetical protein